MDQLDLSLDDNTGTDGTAALADGPILTGRGC